MNSDGLVTTDHVNIALATDVVPKMRDSRARTHFKTDIGWLVAERSDAPAP